ncbi:MAG: hypothetical protein KatS3mg129_0993 [Leptospiraceae bacterium]|nr:MAG: hypothetical protein KatS3mg129_0993 [Leptospiraceae bacterium]
MKNGIRYINKIENELYNISDEEKRLELLEIFIIITSLRDKQLAFDIFQRRRDFMIKSPIIEQIIKESIEEGKKEGIKKGKKEERIYIAKKMKKQGFDEKTIQKITNLTLNEIRKL